VAGVLGKLALWRLAPGVSWLWWNPAGLAVASLVALAADRAAPALGRVRWPRRETALLLAASAAMLLALLALLVLPSLLLAG
jgi:hypothetical protein